MIPERLPFPAGVPAYHDLARVVGAQGVLATWTGPDGTRRAVAFSDVTVRCRKVMAGSPATDDAAAIRSGILQRLAPSRIVPALEDPGADYLVVSKALQAAWPHPDGAALDVLAGGDMAGRRAAAVAALASIRLGDGLREALRAHLDFGPLVDDGAVDCATAAFGNDGYWPVLRCLLEHPWLANSLLNRGPRPEEAERGLMEARLSGLGLSAGHLRRLRKGSPTAPPGSLAPYTLGMLARVPLDTWPADATGWDAFQHAALSAATLERDQAMAPAATLAGAGPRWPAFVDRCARESGRPDGDHVLAAQDVNDPVEALASGVLLPALAAATGWEPMPGRPQRVPAILASRAVRSARTLLLAGKSLPSILRLSRRWHERRADFDLRDPADLAWPPLFEGEVAFPELGVVAVAVHDSVALQEEGAHGPDRDGKAGLSHCIYGRLARYASGEAHVVAFRDAGDGSRLSCAEVRAETAGGRFDCLTVVEHRGPNNSAPAERARKALYDLVDMAHLSRLPLRADALQVRTTRAGDPVVMACGYEWRDMAKRDRARLTWEPLMPRWARDLPEEGFLAALVGHGDMPGAWIADCRRSLAEMREPGGAG